MPLGTDTNPKNLKKNKNKYVPAEISGYWKGTEDFSPIGTKPSKY